MEMLKLRSVDTAVDTEGGTYEMVRIKRGYKTPNIGQWVQPDAIPDYYIQDTVVEWFDELSNYDLMKLTMWCIEHKISIPYNFR